MNYIPNVLEKTNNGEKVYDLYSKLLEDRIILLTGEINDYTSNLIVSELLYLDSISNEDISIYINSPGGSVTSGMAIYDTMNFIKSDVNTIAIGMAASMGAFLLSGGAKGKRYALPNAEIMIHQPLGGTQGQATDMEIEVEHMLRIKKNLISIMAENAGKDYETVLADCERNNWMTAKEALEYGLIDNVVENRK